jgi:hypothetical protein
VCENIRPKVSKGAVRASVAAAAVVVPAIAIAVAAAVGCSGGGL